MRVLYLQPSLSFSSSAECVIRVFFNIADKLKIVYGQQLKGFDAFVHYYGLAVVEKDANFSFKELKGKKSCHTGVGKTVGWKIPVGYLLYNKSMTFTENQYQSAADFFGESCAPGKLNYIRLCCGQKARRQYLLRNFWDGASKASVFLRNGENVARQGLPEGAERKGESFFLTLIRAL